MLDINSIKEIKLIKQSDRQKVLLVEDSDGKKYLKREINGDKREIYKTLEKINHPNIPKIYCVEFESDTVVLEEYVEGELLSQITERGEELKKKQIRSVAKQVLSALEKLHEVEIIHRDIKPDNIIIDKNGHVRLLDYDIAKIYRKEVRRDTEAMGTFGYAPIEQYGVLPTDYKTDIYAFGVTLKTLLDYAGIKGYLYKIAEKCTKLDPAERYESAKKVKTAVDKNALKYSALLVFILILTVSLSFCNPKNRTKPEVGQVSDEQLVQDDVTIPEDTETEDEKKVSENKNTAKPSVEATDKKEEDVTKNQGDIPQDKPVEDPEEPTFDGTFSGFSEGTNEAGYKELGYYSQVCIFGMQTPWEHLIFVDDVNKTGKVKIGKNETIIDADITLENGALSVNLDDGNGNVFSHQFRFDSQYEYEKIYTDNLRKNADIICYDFNGDGATELLVGLSEGSMGAVGNQFYNNVNYCIAWAITYDEVSGFTLCQGDMFSRKYAFWINDAVKKVNVTWEDAGDITGYLMEGNKIISVL